MHFLMNKNKRRVSVPFSIAGITTWKKENRATCFNKQGDVAQRSEGSFLIFGRDIY